MKTICKLFVLMLLLASRLPAQEKISLDIYNERLETAFLQIERQSSYRFVYSNDVLGNKNKVTLMVKAASFEEVISLLLQNTSLAYKIMDKYLVIIQNDDTKLVAERAISGQVTDEQGTPLGSVSITTKNIRNKWTFTDDQGNFRLSVPPDITTLHFDYVGMKPVWIDIQGIVSLNVKMQPLKNSTTEVIVVGYSTQIKKNMTSAVSTVQAKEIVQRIAANPSQLLQGKLPGLQVTQSSGDAGNETVVLQVRGKGTFGASNNPLVIIDGLPGDITALNEYDIESISVLKDAASATIYGSRAASGVIVVTTRKGSKNDESGIEFIHSISLHSATRLPKMIWNSVEYMELYNEALRNANKPEKFTPDDINKFRNSTDPRYPEGFNWMDASTKTPIVTNYHLGFKSRKNNTSYYLGLGYIDQPGVLYGYMYKKYTLQYNLSSKILERLKLGVNTLINYSKKSTPPSGGPDQVLAIMSQPPLLTVKTPGGQWAGATTLSKGAFAAGNKSPFMTSDLARRIDEFGYLQANMFLDINILEGLNFENRGGVNVRWGHSKRMGSRVSTHDMANENLALLYPGGLFIENKLFRYITGYSQLHLNRKFGEYDLNMLAGVQTEYEREEMIGASRLEFLTSTGSQLDAGSIATQRNAGNASEWAINSLYTSADLSIKNRYLIGASFRRDGTSKLAPGHKYGSFYSFSAGWRMSSEAFLYNIPWLSNLKLRLSWGKLGNQDIGTYPYQSLLTPVSYTFNGTTVPGLYQPRFENKKLAWENTVITNIGFDAALFDSRLSVSFDYYTKNTSDILRTAQVPAEFGLSAPTVNRSNMNTTGYELSLGFTNRIGRKLHYNIECIIDAYKSKVANFGTPEIGNITISQNGMEYKSFYLYEYDGIFQSQKEIDNHANMSHFGSKPQPGDIKLKDQDGNGVIDQADKKVFAGQNPAYNYSVSLGFNYKGLDFQALIFGSAGKKFYFTKWGVDPFFQESSPTVEWRNRWTPDNPSATLPRIYKGDWAAAGPQQYTSSYYLKDASYVKLRSITLGYTLQKNRVPFIADLRFFFMADNLLTITKFPKIGDPERTDHSVYYAGSDWFPAYPQVRAFSFGVEIKL